MDDSLVIALASKAMMIVLLLSLPSILLATFVGLGVSLLQALTQVQEQIRYTESIFTLIKAQTQL